MPTSPLSTQPALGLLGFTLLALAACSSGEKPLDTVTESDSVAQQPAPTTPPPPPAPRLLGERYEGEATYYRATGKGNCSFDHTDNLMVAAINTADYANAALCGAHIAVTGPQGSVTVRIVDRCPGCRPHGLDLSREAFEQIAATAKGRVAVSWQIVEGPNASPLSYHYMEGTTRYWTAVQVRNHRWPIEKLEILPNGADEWLPVERRRYNYFVRPKAIAAGPLKVRLTAATGETLGDTLPEPQSSLTVVGHAQFQ